MELVINKCFGGFGLSNKAKKRLMELRGQGVFFYKQTKYDFNDEEEEYILLQDLNDDSMSIITSNKYFGETTNYIPNENYLWIDKCELKRNDKNLIKVVKELGEEANGRFASLKIVEIPDNIEYEISDYDGVESVEERHRIWN